MCWGKRYLQIIKWLVETIWLGLTNEGYELIKIISLILFSFLIMVLGSIILKVPIRQWWTDENYLT